MSDTVCGSCGKPIPFGASKAMVQRIPYHPVCWERMTRGRL